MLQSALLKMFRLFSAEKIRLTLKRWWKREDFPLLPVMELKVSRRSARRCPQHTKLDVRCGHRTHLKMTETLSRRKGHDQPPSFKVRHHAK